MENIDELLKTCQIYQYFPPSKFCAVWYFITIMIMIMIYFGYKKTNVINQINN